MREVQTAKPVLPVLSAEGVTLAYGAKPVVHEVSLAVSGGGVSGGGGVGLIGESGSGKTTLARALLGLLRPRAGVIRYGSRDLAGLDRRARAGFRSDVQPVFQDGKSLRWRADTRPSGTGNGTSARRSASGAAGYGPGRAVRGAGA